MTDRVDLVDPAEPTYETVQLDLAEVRQDILHQCAVLSRMAGARNQLPQMYRGVQLGIVELMEEEAILEVAVQQLAVEEGFKDQGLPALAGIHYLH